MSETDAAAALPIERRLAAILAADFEAYSRLMHADEERAFAILSAHRRAVEGLIATAHGQVFGSAGDSVLAEFPSVVEAFDCAIAIQQTLARDNAALPSAERMALRIGIHVGDVMAKDNDLYGDGVNIAARLEGLAEPGGICVSRAVRDHLRDRTGVAFDDLGEHQVKNIARPLRVFRAVFDPNAEPSLPDHGSAPQPVDEPRSAPSEEDKAIERAFWESVQTTDDDAEYRIYLERYPNGAFAELARARLNGASAGEAPAVELAFWETVREAKSPAMLKAYLEKYPLGEFRRLAEIMLAEAGEG
jgi:class 3 adenylate cyclase